MNQDPRYRPEDSKISSAKALSKNGWLDPNRGELRDAKDQPDKAKSEEPALERSAIDAINRDISSDLINRMGQLERRMSRLNLLVFGCFLLIAISTAAHIYHSSLVRSSIINRVTEYSKSHATIQNKLSEISGRFNQIEETTTRQDLVRLVSEMSLKLDRFAEQKTNNQRSIAKVEILSDIIEAIKSSGVLNAERKKYFHGHWEPGSYR